MNIKDLIEAMARVLNLNADELGNGFIAFVEDFNVEGAK